MSGSIDDVFTTLQHLSLPDDQPLVAGTTTATAYHGTSRQSPIGMTFRNPTAKYTAPVRGLEWRLVRSAEEKAVSSAVDR